MQVDAVHERAGDTAQIAMYGTRRAGAFARRMVVVAARAGIHRRHQREVGRILDAVTRPRDGDTPLFEGLPEHFEHVAAEFGQLVQKEDAVVRQRHFARAGRLSAADERHLRREVVRCAEGPFGEQAAVRSDLARDGVDLGRFERFVERQRRQNRGQPACEHRLARTRRADHQHVVAARRRDFERPLDGCLPLDVGEIFGVAALFLREGGGSCRRCDRPVAAQVLHRLSQRCRTDHLHALDHGRFAGVVARDDQTPQPLFAGLDGHRKDAAHGFERPVERQFARQHRPVERLGRNLLRGGEDAHGDRQVETRPLLAQIGRSEVDHDLAARHLATGILEGRADALLALLDGVVRQSDQKEAQLSGRGDVDLDRDRHGVDACDGSCCDTDEHGLRRGLRRRAGGA